MKKFVLIAALALASSTASAGYVWEEMCKARGACPPDYAPAEGR